jgi:serine/threonine protein kinase
VKSCWKCGSSVPETYRYCLACGADVDAGPKTVRDPWIGRSIASKYRLEEVIGSGAMGTIYKAEQVALGKQIVIKLLHRHLLGDPELTQRFEREARAASRLNHPNCVQIIDFGQTEDGSLYIAMEYIPGDDLATLLERQFPIDLRRLVHIFKQVCLALDEAHANGVLHRDLKPENIMVADRRNEPDFVKVVDFGIAKLEDNNPNSRRSFQTRTGIVCGTPEYMSPEQARGKDLDPRSDIYALGVALYHLVTDRLPFDAPSPIEIVTKHLTEDPIPPRQLQPYLPPSFERLILAMMDKDREKRPSSVMDVYAELERIDRDLAVERREQVEQKTHDDATLIDYHPSELIRAAILDATANSAREDATRETTAHPERHDPRPNQQSSTALLPAEGLDTIQESGGVALDSPAMRAAADRQDPKAAGRKASTAPGRKGPAAGRKASETAGRKASETAGRKASETAGRKASETAGRRASATAGRRASTAPGRMASTAPGRKPSRRPPDVALGVDPRAQITISTPPAPGPETEAEVLAAALPRRRTTVVVAVGLGVAAVLGLATWIVVTVLQAG